MSSIGDINLKVAELYIIPLMLDNALSRVLSLSGHLVERVSLPVNQRNLIDKISLASGDLSFWIFSRT